jgi:hypothetical protein
LAINKLSERDSAALGVLESNSDGMLALSVNALGSVAAREAVRKDLLIFDTIGDGHLRHFSAVAMGENAKHHPAYQVELQHQNPTVANEVDTAYKENRRRLAVKDERATAALYSMVAAARVDAEEVLNHDSAIAPRSF